MKLDKYLKQIREQNTSATTGKSLECLELMITCQSCRGSYGSSPESCCTDCMNTGVDNDPSSIMLKDYYDQAKYDIPTLLAIINRLEGMVVDEIGIDQYKHKAKFIEALLKEER